MATVDVEEEYSGVLSTIFTDSFPESWRDNPDFAQYLAQLSSYGVDKLGREPERLAEERAQILEQTQDLAFHNYKTFIQTAECSRDIFQDFQIIEQHVGGVLEKLPGLLEQCKDFMTRAQEINVSRRMNNVTLQRHTQLLEVLEIPQLMDTCVRNSYYEEALELAAHVKRLEKKHANIPVIANIVSEVRNCSQLMLNQLIQQLRTNIQLPACLRVIGYLRRMDVLTEAELRIKFLQARDTWFQGILDGIPADDPYYHITKTIEASRVHLFDIITQYRAIFSDEDPLLTSGKDDGPNEGALFHGWVVQKVQQFLLTLERDLGRGVGGRLDSVLGQCMYFGLSFSRVGADFRGLLAPIFQKAALSVFMTAIVEANQRFDEAMQSYTLLGTPSMLPSTAFTLATQGTGLLQPPMILLEFPPLAAYCNNILNALNDLRLCAPLSLASDVARHLQGSLEFAVHNILAYHRAEEATFNKQEEEKFGQFCHAFANELLPHLNRCLQTLFPPPQLAQMLGVTVIDLVRMGNLGLIDVKTVVHGLEHLIPAAPEEPKDPIGQAPQASPATADSGESQVTLPNMEVQETKPSENTDISTTDQSAESLQPQEEESTHSTDQSELTLQDESVPMALDSEKADTDPGVTSDISDTKDMPDTSIKTD